MAPATASCPGDPGGSLAVLRISPIAFDRLVLASLLAGAMLLVVR